ncbi:MAG TPA: hypothetical protein VFS91_04280 [Nitrobacter sp.]|nr:hypothetical protein [Nitrobacter sp.]
MDYLSLYGLLTLHGHPIADGVDLTNSEFELRGDRECIKSLSKEFGIDFSAIQESAGLNSYHFATETP